MSSTIDNVPETPRSDLMFTAPAATSIPVLTRKSVENPSHAS